MGSMEQEIELKMGHQGHGGVAALKRINPWLGPFKNYLIICAPYPLGR